MMLHEVEYFQHKQRGRAVTGPKNNYGTRVINYGSSFLVTMLGIFILSTIIFLGHVFVLLFPCLQVSPCPCCCAIRRSEGFSNHSHRGERRGTKPASNLELRNKRNRLQFRLRNPQCACQSDMHVVAKNVNVNPFKFPVTRFWLRHIYSYLRQLSGLPTEEADALYKAESGLFYLRQSSGFPLKRSGSLNRVGKQVRRHRRRSRRLVSYCKRKNKKASSIPMKNGESEQSKRSSQLETSLKSSVLQSSLLFSSTSRETSYSLSTIHTLNLPTMSGDGSNTTTPLTTPASFALPANYRFGVMPRPGQPGALHFDNTNISEFLRRWNNECEDFGLTDAQKCSRLPDYCTPETKDTIELLSGYTESNWTTLQSELKSLFWQLDKQKDTTESLNKLIQDAPAMDLNVYLLKYTSISNTLVQKGALSTLDRVNRFLDGLSPKLRERALEFCTKKEWRLSSHDTGTTEPVFDELKDFITTKAKAAQKKTVYDKEYAIRNGKMDAATSPTSPTPTAMPIATPIATPTAMPITKPTAMPVQVIATTPTSAPASDSVAELTKQFARLALAMEASMQGRLPVSVSNVNAPTPISGSPSDRPQCVWCDSTKHRRRECSEFTEALHSQRVSLNDRGRVVFNGEELPLMWGKGGMKKLLSFAAPTVPITVGNNNITLESYGDLGSQSSVMITTLDFENGTRTDEIIDAEVNEKRRRDEILRRRVRPRLEEDVLPHAPALPRVPIPPVPLSGPTPEIVMQDVQDNRRSTTPGNSEAAPKKFRLVSDLSQTVSTSQIGEKIMDTPVQLSMREVLAVSSEVSSYLHDQTRKRRVPIDPLPVPVPAAANTANMSSSVLASSVNSGYLKKFYACPSGRAKVTLDHELNVNSLMDNGSELNMMPRRIFERLDLPIDTDIRWRIDKYDSQTNAELDEHGPIGVCHDVSVDIGGVDVKQPIFVVEYCNNDLILGRPWERMVRAEFINEDDGSYTTRIKSPDGSKVVQFCAVKAEHERNREFARPVENGSFGNSLKV
jgi:hypothetical protein